MNTLEKILERGFGMISINSLMSINYCNDEMKLVFSPAPGFNEDSVYFPIEGRTIGEIYQEIYSYTNAYMAMYLDRLQSSVTKL